MKGRGVREVKNVHLMPEPQLTDGHIILKHFLWKYIVQDPVHEPLNRSFFTFIDISLRPEVTTRSSLYSLLTPKIQKYLIFLSLIYNVIFIILEYIESNNVSRHGEVGIFVVRYMGKTKSIFKMFGLFSIDNCI